MVTSASPQNDVLRGYEAIETAYHAMLTGVILKAVMVRGGADAAEMVFRLFRRQHLDKFIPGLEKLGLANLPPAVACAQYHYLSNHLGGVKVEYIPEHDRKAWVRYPPPRWIFDGTAVCGIPSEVSRAMLRGWHGHNGVSLGNLRLGFVCTKQTVDGQPGLEGYYYEYDRDLEPDERVRFSPGEEAPPFDPDLAPALDSNLWPEDRLRKVLRNYAMDYIRNLLPEMVALFGPEEARRIGGAAARQIGMQFYDATAALVGVRESTSEGFAHYLAALMLAQGDSAEVSVGENSATVAANSWRLMRGLHPVPEAAFEIWNALWEGALSVHNRFLRLSVLHRPSSDEDGPQWKIEPR